MNGYGYQLTKAFYAELAENEDMQVHAQPHHQSLYTWICELRNRTKMEVVDLPREHTMKMSLIGSPSKLASCIDELEKWGFIQVLSKGNKWGGATKVRLQCSFLNKYCTESEQQANIDRTLSEQRSDIIKTVETGKKVETDKPVFPGSDKPEVSHQKDQTKTGKVLDTYPEEFEAIWKLYAKPSASKKDAYREWQKLKPDERLAAMAKLPAYLTFQPEAKYRKDPERYFKNRTWENDFSSSPPVNGHALIPVPNTTRRPQAITDIR